MMKFLVAQSMCQEVLASQVEADAPESQDGPPEEPVQDNQDDKIVKSLMKLHKNLSHPSNAELIRVLKHGQASEKALSLARDLQCPMCEARRAPAIPPPAQTSHAVDFNQRVGIDVKHLQGWKVNQKVKALNIVDMATGFQTHGAVFFEVETAGLLRKLLNDRWPFMGRLSKRDHYDPARTNLGRALTEPAELEGTHISTTAAAAHWQHGKTEVHGGLFAKFWTKCWPKETFQPG